MAKLAHIGLGFVIGVIAGVVAGGYYGRSILADRRHLSTEVAPITPFIITDTGDFISALGVMKVADHPIIVAYPGNGFQVNCTKTGCATLVALAGNGFLNIERGSPKIREFSVDRVVFEEDGGVLSMVLGKHRSFTFTLDRKAKTLRAVGWPDETTNYAGANVVFQLTGLGRPELFGTVLGYMGQRDSALLGWYNSDRQGNNGSLPGSFWSWSNIK